MKKIYGYFDTEFAMFLFGLFILCIGIFSIAFFLDHSACTSRARGLGLESDWGPVQGCLVKVGNRYAPIEYIRITDDEKIIISGDGQ